MRDVPLRTAVCDACWALLGSVDEDEDEDDPVAVGEVVQALQIPSWSDPRQGGQATCRDCGLPGQWYSTVRHRHVLLEPDPWPLYQVPAGQRWRIASDGTAVNMGRAAPMDECRITHWLVCPARPGPAVSAPHLQTLWHNRRSAASR